MIENEFGRAGRIGAGIARAKGRLKTYLKKQLRKVPIMCGIALVLGIVVRCTVAQAFYAAGKGAEPLIPQGSRVLVYKLARTFSPGDVIVYRADGNAYLGIVRKQTTDGLVVYKHDEPDKLILSDQVVGRVFLNTR